MRLIPDQPTLFDPEPYIRHGVDCPLCTPGGVYAVQMPSHAIKIGWTARSPFVRARELGGVLLGYRVGTMHDESAVHELVSAFRIGRTEDFWPSPLVWSIVRLMFNHGDVTPAAI